MSVINHTVRPEYDIMLAMIEGTEVTTFCLHRMVPTVTPGTSGRADVPGAPQCERCEQALDLNWRWSRMKDEKNRLLREMRAIEKQHKELMRSFRDQPAERETVTA